MNAKSAGKGDSPRSCFSQQFRDNYDRIFRGKRPRKVIADSDYSCVIIPKPPIKLKSETVSIPMQITRIELMSDSEVGIEFLKPQEPLQSRENYERNIIGHWRKL